MNAAAGAPRVAQAADVSPAERAQDRAAATMPAVFVLLWSTGFIAARFATPHADPFTFLAIRFAMSAVAFVAIAAACRVHWPRTGQAVVRAILNGALIHGVYLAGVFWAIRNGLPAGVAALVSGLQPLMTAVIASVMLGERLQGRQWLGIAIGMVGVALVVAPALGAAQAVRPLALLAAFGGTLAITLGTVWQKRTGAALDLRANAALQYVGATLVVALLAFGTEPLKFDNSLTLWACLLWSVFGLSIGAVSLLFLLLARDAATDVAALLYLVPPVSALLAFVTLGETLTPVQMIGMIVTTLAVKAVRFGSSGNAGPNLSGERNG